MNRFSAPSGVQAPRAGHHLVLAYHGVDATQPSDMATRPEVFEEQIRLAVRLGFVGLTFRDRERRRLSGDLPKKSVVITFDDGHKSTLRGAEILARYGYPGTVFPMLNFIEEGVPWHWDGYVDPAIPMSWGEVEGLAESGWEVGSHTIHHLRLSSVPDDLLNAELVESRKALVSRFGRCDTIAFPHGDADARVARAVERAGYSAGATLSAFHLVDEPARRPRVGLEDRTGAALRYQFTRAAQVLRTSHRLAYRSGEGRAELSRI